MTKRAKFALLVVLTLALVIGMIGTAFAVPPAGGWTDLSYSDVGPYGITLEQVGIISDGYTDGSWKPYANMSRAHFVKMAVDAYKIPLVNPATPTYTDVPASHPQYQWIEAAAAANLTNGVGGGLFKPEDTITREQAAAIIVRWVAQKNGYDLATMYTADSAAAILAEFPDGATVSASLQKEIDFAVQMGIMWGTNVGTLAPAQTLLRLQGAAMIIRSWAIVPAEEPAMPPADIDVIAGDGSENLIGQTHTVTFKVVDANGDPVEGALVDFDALTDAWYVGNIEPEAALTDADGEVSVILASTEIGVQRVTATVRGEEALYTAYANKYWVAIDEVYFVGYEEDLGIWAQNNAGTSHTWEARVVVFGPGPWSTSRQDFYNAVAVDAAGSPVPSDGVAADLNNYYDELAWADEGYAPRTMAGVPVEWNIVDQPDNPATILTNESIASVGLITDATVAGVVAADGQSATAVTDEEGLTSIQITSDKKGQTLVTVAADYDENPYPGLLVNRDIYINEGYDFEFMADGSWWGMYNWWWDDFDGYVYLWGYGWLEPYDESEDQPYGVEYWSVADWEPQPGETAQKIWISHTMEDADSNISPAFEELNTGEEILLTLTLKDEYGNPVSGREVEWTMQGVGQFKEDDGQVVSNPWYGPDNMDVDTTDVNGTCRLLAKSTKPGEQIIHAKYRDKGTDGKEGAWRLDVAELQWFEIDVVTFDNPATTGIADNPATIDWNEANPQNEAVASNEVGTEHTFDVWVYGLKLEYDPQVNFGEESDQTPWIDTDAAGRSYDGVMDKYDAAYFNPDGILLVNEDEVGGDYDPATGKVDDAVYVDSATGMKLGAGGITEYDWDADSDKDSVADANLATGIYLPLEGKGIDFVLEEDSVGAMKAAGDPGEIEYGGTTFVCKFPAPPADWDALTDEEGNAWVTVASDKKGPTVVEAIADYPANPHYGRELVSAWAKKTWTTQAAPDASLNVTINGASVKPGGTADAVPVITANGELNWASLEVHVVDEFGNELPDYEVVYEIVDDGQDPAGQGTVSTYHPWTYLTDMTPDGTIQAGADLDARYPDTNPWTNAASGQTYAIFTSVGTSHTGDFSAELVNGYWNWEFAVQGLKELPADPDGANAGPIYVTYTLWVADDDLVPAERLADFNVNADGVLEDGKIFGSVADAAVDFNDYAVVVVTAQTAIGETDPDLPKVLAGELAVVGVADGNGILPDNSEPRNDDQDAYQEGVGPDDGSDDADWADANAVIVGDGGTEAYWFDRNWPEEVDSYGNGPWTDGAKAWTLNGVEDTRPHGSAVDLRLNENPYWYADADVNDVLSVVNIQVYAPDDGPTVDGTPLWAFEVKVDWAPTDEVDFAVDITPVEQSNPVGAWHTVDSVLPDGANASALYFVWYLNDMVVNEGWGVTYYDYQGWVPGADDEIWFAVYADEYADPIAVSPVAYKSWSDTSVGIQQWAITGYSGEFQEPIWGWTAVAAENTVGDTHYVRVDDESGFYYFDGLWLRWIVDGEVESEGPAWSYYGDPAADDPIDDMMYFWDYSETVAQSDVITLEVWSADGTVLLETSNALAKEWIPGDPYALVNPEWILSTDYNVDSDPEWNSLWRSDSDAVDPSHALLFPIGSVFYYRAQVVDYYGNLITETDVSGSYPMIQRIKDDTTTPPTDASDLTYSQSDPDSPITNSAGRLYWTGVHGNTGWNGTTEGDEGYVTFFLDIDPQNGVYDWWTEVDTSPGTYWTNMFYDQPSFHWLFG